MKKVLFFEVSGRPNYQTSSFFLYLFLLLGVSKNFTVEIFESLKKNFILNRPQSPSSTDSCFTYKQLILGNYEYLK